MERKEVAGNVGKRCSLNGLGDLFMNSSMRPYIRHGDSENFIAGTIVKLTRGGLVLIKFDDGQTRSVAPRNVTVADQFVSRNPFLVATAPGWQHPKVLEAIELIKKSLDNLPAFDPAENTKAMQQLFVEGLGRLAKRHGYPEPKVSFMELANSFEIKAGDLATACLMAGVRAEKDPPAYADVQRAEPDELVAFGPAHIGRSPDGDLLIKPLKPAEFIRFDCVVV